MREGWGKIRAAAEYSGVSVRTVRTWLKEGLRHARLPTGTILIKFEWVDEYLEGFVESESAVDMIVDGVVGDLRSE